MFNSNKGTPTVVMFHYYDIPGSYRFFRHLLPLLVLYKVTAPILACYCWKRKRPICCEVCRGMNNVSLKDA